jgi:hypothetical protein
MLKPTTVRRHTGPDDDTVITVLMRSRRDGHACCEICGGPITGERGRDWCVHHRRGRDGVRTDNRVENLLLCCGADNQAGCHGRIHGRRGEAEPAGWWISRIPALGGHLPDPATVSVLIDNGSRVVYLGADGGYHDNPPGGGE